MRTLFLAWQDYESRRWYPVGRLVADGDRYRFFYLQGARRAQREAGFRALDSFPSLDDFYESDILFPLFQNRVLSPSRPDFLEFLEYLNLPATENDPVVLLARSGGRRATDALEVFPCPQRTGTGEYHIHFFVHGLRHLPEGSVDRVGRLRAGERLLLAKDFQNPEDPEALLLRTQNAFERDRYLVGYCPRYLTADAMQVILRCGEVNVRVERVNPPPAPMQFRLLCSLTGCWPADWQPFSGEDYVPINEASPVHVSDPDAECG